MATYNVKGYRDTNGNIYNFIPSAFNGEPIGVITMCLTSAVPEGYVPLTGGVYNKTTYGALFSYATAAGLLKTEQEWQALYGSNSGNVPYYANTSATTFRVPSIKGWVKADNSMVGYINQAGLPNIEGEIQARGHARNEDYNGALTGGEGAFEYHRREGAYGDNGVAEGSVGSTNDKMLFNASHSNPIYGNSDTVQPFGPNVIFAVKAFGKAVDDSTISVSEALTNIQNAGPKIKVW